MFWVDERVVPKDHPDSNYLLAYDGFLSKVRISSSNAKLNISVYIAVIIETQN